MVNNIELKKSVEYTLSFLPYFALQETVNLIIY